MSMMSYCCRLPDAVVDRDTLWLLFLSCCSLRRRSWWVRVRTKWLAHASWRQVLDLTRSLTYRITAVANDGYMYNKQALHGFYIRQEVRILLLMHFRPPQSLHRYEHNRAHKHRHIALTMSCCWSQRIDMAWKKNGYAYCGCSYCECYKFLKSD